MNVLSRSKLDNSVQETESQRLLHLMRATRAIHQAHQKGQISAEEAARQLRELKNGRLSSSSAA